MTTNLPRSDAAMPFENYGVTALRWSLILVFLWFGFLKFSTYEAEGISLLAINSPLLSWAYQILGQRGFAMALGVVEISIGILIALRPVSPQLSSIGSVGSIITYLITLSLLLSTPGVWQEGYAFPFLSGNIGQFLIKDLVLLAASICIAAEAFAAARMQAQPLRVASQS